MASQIVFTQAAAPSTPSAGTTALYGYTDGNLYVQTSSGGPFSLLSSEVHILSSLKAKIFIPKVGNLVFEHTML